MLLDEFGCLIGGEGGILSSIKIEQCAQERLFKHLRLFDKDNSREALTLRSISVSFVSREGQTLDLSDCSRRGEDKKV